MATESPIRISGAGSKWPSIKEAATFAPPSHNMAAEDLGMLLKGHRFHNGGKDVIPNRSGSAPPNMEGSFLAIENLLSQQNFTQSASLETLNRPMQIYASGKSSLYLPRGTLATHKEESEDDQSPQQPYDNEFDKMSRVWQRPDAASIGSQHKNMVDLIQEDFPRTASPVYSKSISANHGMVEEAIDLDAGSSSSHDPLVTTVDGAKFIANAEDMRLSSIVDTSAPVASSSSLVSTENQSYEEKLKLIYHNNLIQPQTHQQRNNPYEVPSTNPQGVNGAYVGIEQSPLNPSKFSSDVQPLLQSSGFTPHYMPQQQDIWHQRILIIQICRLQEFVVDGATSSSFTPHSPGVSSGGSISHGAELIHANKFIGQFGFPLQSSFGDPMYMQYHQQPFVEGYGFSGNYDQLASRASAGAQIGHFDSRRGLVVLLIWMIKSYTISEVVLMWTQEEVGS
ncbi:hypothetical protein K1719_016528 [Acacia pycnantha]|nr:hypothetical protein K1719_016528 [Acacia pycnantha]